MQTTLEADEFADITSPAECLLVAHRLMGPELVTLLLGIDPDRQSLSRAAAELKCRAPADLVEMVKQAAREAPRRPQRTFSDMVRKRRRRRTKRDRG
jgi:hypothetical protein